MEKRLIKKSLLYILLAILLLVSTVCACGRKEQRPAPEEKKESIPKPLQQIGENSQAIIEQMEKLQQEMEKPATQQGEQQQGSRGGGGGEEQQGGQQEEQGGGQQSPPDPEEEKKQRIEKIWEETLKIVEDTHKQWNDYENTAVKDKARNTAISGFESSLNALTVAVNQKKLEATMEHANRMSLVAADFLDLYKNNPDGQIARVRYYLQQSCIDARKGNWDQAQRRVRDGKQAVEELEREAELEEADKGLMEKLSLSVDNMGNAMEDRDLDLLKIKKDIALENLKAVEEKAK